MRHPYLTLERVGPAVVLVLVLGAIVWGSVIPRLRSANNSDAIVELSVRIDGYQPGSDISSRLSGDLTVSELLQNAAACRNGTDWLSDITIGTDVLVSRDPQLVRAAELITDGAYDNAMVVDIEQLLIDGNDPARVSERLTDEWPTSDVADYLADRARPPSAAASSRFVGYATRKNVLGDVLLVIDTTALNVSAIDGFAAENVHAAIYLAGSDGEPRGLPARRCRNVVDDLGD